MPFNGPKGKLTLRAARGAFVAHMGCSSSKGAAVKAAAEKTAAEKAAAEKAAAEKAAAEKAAAEKAAADKASADEKKEEAAATAVRHTRVLWDFENVGVPSGIDPFEAVCALERWLETRGLWGAGIDSSITAFFNPDSVGERVRKALDRAGVEQVLASSKREDADRKLNARLERDLALLPTGAATAAVFITSDTDFIPQLRRLKQRGGPTVLLTTALHGSQHYSALALAATETHPWEAIVHSSGGQTVAAVAKGVGSIAVVGGGGAAGSSAAGSSDAGSVGGAGFGAALADSASEVNHIGALKKEFDAQRLDYHAVHKQFVAVGPPHLPRHTCTLTYGKHSVQSAEHTTKKAAEQDAAERLLVAMQQGALPTLPSSPPPSSQYQAGVRYEAKCTYWDGRGGWGKLSVQHGGTLFVHNTALLAGCGHGNRRSLRRGDLVSCAVGSNSKGACAVDVKLVARSPAPAPAPAPARKNNRSGPPAVLVKGNSRPGSVHV